MSGRSIAPRPAAHTADTSITSHTAVAGSNESQATTSQAPSVGSASTRKKVTSACQSCQKRRVKCDGNQPCATCSRTKTDCVYTRELDGRSIKRKYHEVQRDQELLNDLLLTIRHSQDDYVTQIVSLVRSDASMEDVKACVAQQVSEMQLAGHQQSPEFRQLQDRLKPSSEEYGARSHTGKRSDVLGIQRLADRPLHKVPASPWTTVTDDDDLVSNLISVWLTWDKGWQDWIDEECFIRDMQAGSLESNFCSPFLVNCLLGWGCPYSDFREARVSHGSGSELMFKFIAEAKRLLEDEKGTGLCLTTIQGLLFLHANLAVIGNDGYGYRYLLEAIAMTQDLMSSPVATKIHSDPKISTELSRVIDKTCWGVYIVTSQTLSSILKPQLMKPPRRSRPGKTDAGSSVHLWRPYPYGDEAVQSYRNEFFDFGCDLAIIEAELTRTLFDSEEQSSAIELENKVSKLHDDLQQRLFHLPQELTPTIGSCPSLFAHRAHIQSVILRMFLGFREAPEGASPAMVRVARIRCVDAAIEIAHVCKLYMESWGAAIISVMMCQPCVLSLVVLLEEQDSPRYFSEITDLCITFRALSRRWPICMGMFRMIQLEARRKGWRLPPQTDKLFEEFEGSAWRQREVKRYATLYPFVDASKSVNFTGDEIDMGRFLESMESLELEDPAVDSDYP